MLLVASGGLVLYRLLPGNVRVQGFSSLPQSPQASPSTSSFASALQGRFDPANESSILLAMEFVKKNPSDANVLEFIKYSTDWLEERANSIGDTNLASGNVCLEYVKKHPQFHLSSGTLDDVCTLEFERGFFSKSFGDIVSPACVAYLKIQDRYDSADFDIGQIKDVVVLAERWLNAFKDAEVLKPKVDVIYDETIDRLFHGVHDGMMVLSDSEGRLLPEVLQTYEQLAKEQDGQLSGNVAKKIVAMAQKNEGRLSPEVADAVDQILKKEHR